MKYLTSQLLQTLLSDMQSNLLTASINEVFARHYLEVASYQSRPKQSLTMRNNLKKWLNVEYLHQISEPIISSLVAEQRNNYSPATINRYLALLSAVLNNSRKKWHYECKETHMEQFKLQEPAENVKYIPNWTISKKILKLASKWFRPLVYVAMKTGLRRGSLLELKWSDIDFDHMVINIKVKSKKYAGGKNFSLPLLPDVANVIKALPRKNEYVFQSPTGVKLKHIDTTWRNIFYKWQIVKDTDTISSNDLTQKRTFVKKDGSIIIKTYKQVLKDPELPYVNFHTLRHTVGTWLSFSGANSMIIKDVLGHKDIRTSKKICSCKR